jgi:hypothetical protein
LHYPVFRAALSQSQAEAWQIIIKNDRFGFARWQLDAFDFGLRELHGGPLDRRWEEPGKMAPAYSCAY